jgi:hypothetical protein
MELSSLIAEFRIVSITMLRGPGTPSWWPVLFSRVRPVRTELLRNEVYTV